MCVPKYEAKVITFFLIKQLTNILLKSNYLVVPGLFCEPEQLAWAVSVSWYINLI